MRIHTPPGSMPGTGAVSPLNNQKMIKYIPLALGLDRQPVRQTRTLTPNPNSNLNLNPNHNPIREMHMTNVSLIYITIEVTFPAIT